MSKKSDDFLDWLLSKKINQYRLEMLTDFISAPQLLMGDGLRSFEVLTLFFPTLQIGPQGLPVPGGVFSTNTNALKYPATTRFSHDILDSMNLRNTDLNSSTPEGSEVIPDAQGENWKHVELAFTLVAGVGAVANMATGAAGFNHECMVNYVIVRAIDAPDLVQMVLTFTAGTSSVLGQNQAITIQYKYDATNSIIGGDLLITFPQGKRMVTNAQSTQCRCSVAGGAGAELVVLGYSYRYVVSTP